MKQKNKPKKKAWSESFDPKTYVTTYQGFDGPEYVVQVNCVLPLIGLGISRRVIVPYGLHENQVAVDASIAMAKQQLLSDAVVHMMKAMQSPLK